MQQPRPDLKRSVLITAAGTAWPPAAALISAPMLARGLGVEARGEVAAAQAVALLAISITAFGLPEALTHYVARGSGRGRRTAVGVLAITVGAGLASWSALLATAEWLGGGDPETVAVIHLSAASVLPALLLGLVRGRCSGRELWGRIAAERIVGSSFRLVGVAILFIGGYLGPMSATAVVAFGPLVGAFAYVRLPKVNPVVAPETGLRELVNYSFRVWIGAISGILLMRIDQSLLVPLAGPAQLGLYAVAVSISELPLVVNSAIRDVSFARHSGNFQVNALAQAARMSALICAVLATLAAILSPLFIPLLFGVEFQGAVPVTWILLAAVTIGTPGSIAGAGLSAIGHPGLRSASLTVAAIFNLIALLIFAPLWGAVGAALATVVGNIISSNANIYLLKRRSLCSWSDFYVWNSGDAIAIAATISALRLRIFGKRKESRSEEHTHIR